MGGQQVLKNAAFERLHGGPEQGRVQLRQLQQNGVRAPLYGGRVGGGQGRGLGRGSSSGGISHGRAAKAAKKKPKPAMMPALGLFARVSAIFSGLIGQKPLEISTLADILEGLQVQPRLQAPSALCHRLSHCLFKRVVMQRRSFLAVLPLGALLAACSPAGPTQWLIGTKPSRRPCSGVFRMTCPWRVVAIESGPAGADPAPPNPANRGPAASGAVRPRAGQGVDRSGQPALHPGT